MRSWRLVVAVAAVLAVILLACTFIAGRLSWATYASSKEPFFSIKYPKGYAVAGDYLDPLSRPGNQVWGVAFAVPPELLGATTLVSGSLVVEYAAADTCTAKVFLPDASSTALTDGGVTYSVAKNSRTDRADTFEEKVYALPGSKPCMGVQYALHTDTKAGYNGGGAPGRQNPSASALNTTPQEVLKIFDTMRRSLKLK